MRPIHINTAEAIFEPFWDSDISEMDEWEIKKIGAAKIRVEQKWCMVHIKWAGCEDGAYAVEMRRSYDYFQTGSFDRLTVSAVIPQNGIICVNVQGAGKSFEQVFEYKDGEKHEYDIDISQTDVIENITIKAGAGDKKDASFWINWIGLCDTKRLDGYLDTKGQFDKDTWGKHLKDESYKPAYKPEYGILIDENELDLLRQKFGHSFSFDAASLEEPEWYIGDYVNFLVDTRFNRERDKGRSILRHGQKAAIAGIILKDKSLLRLAARFALSISLCENWDDGFICRFPTSIFNHRCFVQSLCLYECALILDLAGEFFTDAGRELVLRKMSEEGISAVNYNTWKYEYIFHCNQMAWFSPGRMYAYAVLSKNYPRVNPYMDLALEDVIENINNTIEEDGGYLEGPGYFSCVGRDAVQALYIYARATGKKLESIVPEVLAKSTVFAELMESTDESRDYISICDAGYKVKPSFMEEYKLHIAFMAYLFPESVWPDIFKKHIRIYGEGKNPLIYVLREKMTNPGYERRNFIKMEITGHTSSYRKTKHGYSKIMTIGNKSGAGHNHSDKGSFVYEYEGETFIMDPGICTYGNAVSLEMKTANWHNMLIPVSDDDMPMQENPLNVDIIPKACGDEKSYWAKTDLTPGWEEWYGEWVREIDSPSPDEITICDTYELKKGEGVEFLINSPHKITVEGDKAHVNGNKNKLTIQIPDGCSTRIDKMPNPDIPHYRLSIIKEGQSGSIKVEFKMD